MGLFTSTPGKTTETSQSTTTMRPDEKIAGQWDEHLAQAKDIAANAGPPPNADVAAPSDLTKSYWDQARQQQPFDTQYYNQPLRETYGETSGARIDPTGINFKQDYAFAPGALDYKDPYAAGVPQVGPGGGLGSTAAAYQTPWERVSAQQVAGRDISAPGAIERISGLERVSAPELQYYQMGPAERIAGQNVRDFQMAGVKDVTAPQLQQYLMQAAQNVAPGGLASTRSWTDPGVAQQYMSPYQQQVSDVQKKRALEDWQVSNQMLGAEAAKAGAFGGSRHGVREATATRDMQDQMAMIQATGLQNAYQSGMGQFTGEQAMGLQAQQFNLGQGMQASLANQAAQQQAAQMNLQSQLQTQGLGAQMGLQSQLANQAAGLQVGTTNLAALQQAEALRTGYGQQAALANQAAGLTVGQANLGANLQTQGLGAQLNMQGQLANQQQTFQQAVANQAASKFQAEQQMQASLANQANAMEAARANQTAMLQAGMANQQTGAQLGLAATQMGFQGAQFNAQQAMEASRANQAAGMQMLGDQYKGNLAGAMQTQNLGFQGQVRGAEMNQQGAFQTEQQKQNAMNFNLNALNSQATMANNMANLGLGGYAANIAGQDAMNRAAQSEQGYQQHQQDVQYANAMNQYMNPFQTNSWYAQQLAMQPQSTTQTSSGSSQGTQIAPQAGIMQQIIGGALGAASLFAPKIPGMHARGGLIDAYAQGGRTKQRPFGLLTPGNIDLHKRPVVRNADGSISTVRSASFSDNGREVLVPTVSDDGRILKDKDAWEQYLRTGKHLGIFKSPKHATSYAEKLHKQQEQEYAPARFQTGGLGISGGQQNLVDDPGEYMYTTPEGLAVYAPPPGPARPPTPSGLGETEEPDWIQDLYQKGKKRYGELQSTVGKTPPRELGFAKYLYPEKRTGPPAGGGLGEFIDVASMLPIIGAPMSVLGKGTKTFGKGVELIERAAQSPLGRKLATMKNVWDVGRNAKTAKLLEEARALEDTGGRILQRAAPELAHRKPLMIPQEKPVAQPTILDQFGRPAEPTGLGAATEQPPGLIERAQQWLGKKASPKTQAKIDARRAELERMGVTQDLLPMEQEKLVRSGNAIESFKTLTRELPNAYRMESMALLGSPKRGWYTGSSRAILDIFDADAPRFAQTLAAMSPQTSVENNLTNALTFWGNWTKAGRPTDPKAISHIMGQSVMGTKGEKSILPAWLPNVTRALTAEDPWRVTLSGPKVDSFYRNLLSEVKKEWANRVTNDTWQANIGDYSQNWLSGKPTKLQESMGDPGFGPAYAAASAPVRAAGRSLGWKPMEVQETSWSAAKLLSEKAQELGIPVQEVLNRGLVTREALQGTPDFARLLPQGQNAELLKRAGYEEQLANMRPPLPLAPTRDMTLAQQREAMRVADTLERLHKRRALGEQFTKGIYQKAPKKGKAVSVPAGGLGDLVGTEMAEAIPGAGIGHLSGLPTAKWKQKEKYTAGMMAPFETVRGTDALYDALNMRNVAAEKNFGSWRPKGRRPEVNPQYTIPVDVPMMGGAAKGEPYPSWMVKANSVLATRGALLGQKGQAMNILRQSENQTSPGMAAQMTLNRSKDAPKFTEKTMRKIMTKNPHMDFGHTGPQLNVFDFATQAGLSKQELDHIQKLVNAKRWVRADSLGPYVDYTDEWAMQPGSGSVTRKLFSYVEQLDHADFAALDRAVRQPAGKLFDFTLKQRGAKRQDLLNLMQIIRDKGLVGAKKALESGAFLPGLVGAIVAPSMLSQSDEESLQ